MPAKDETGIVSLAKEIGSLSGGQQAMLSELQRISSELVRLAAELDKKHEENLNRIDQRHTENITLLNLHKDEDNKNFTKIFRIWNMVAGGCSLVAILWALLKFLVPLIIAAKGLGD